MTAKEVKEEEKHKQQPPLDFLRDRLSRRDSNRRSSLDRDLDDKDRDHPPSRDRSRRSREKNHSDREWSTDRDDVYITTKVAKLRLRDQDKEVVQRQKKHCYYSPGHVAYEPGSKQDGKASPNELREFGDRIQEQEDEGKEKHLEREREGELKEKDKKQKAEVERRGRQRSPLRRSSVDLSRSRSGSPSRKRSLSPSRQVVILSDNLGNTPGPELHLALAKEKVRETEKETENDQIKEQEHDGNTPGPELGKLKFFILYVNKYYALKISCCL